MDDSTTDGVLDTVEYTLINLVRHYPVLYNPQHPYHRDRVRKDSVWTGIARQIHKEDGWCYTKWQNLRDYYKKRKKIYDAGSGVGRKWIYFDAMSFLDPFDNVRDSNTNNTNTIGHNFSELSSHSVRSNEENSNQNEHLSTEGSDGNHNYFDETQYHSLDGISERAEVKLAARFLDPLSDSCPPLKRQKVTQTHSSTCTGPAHVPIIPTSSTNSNVEFTNSPENQCGSASLNSESIYNNVVTPAIVSVTSVAQPKQTTSNGKNFKENNDKDVLKLRNGITSDFDCPHYLFCMSLAARFRKMDEANATYTQMKIMELILKTEHPEMYTKRGLDM